jgi:hypothetical protein
MRKPKKSAVNILIVEKCGLRVMLEPPDLRYALLFTSTKLISITNNNSKMECLPTKNISLHAKSG